MTGQADRERNDIRGTAIRWLFETVEDGGADWAVKQMVVEPDGTVHRYSWERLEDASGFRVDQPLDPSRSRITTIDADEFVRRWRG